MDATQKLAAAVVASCASGQSLGVAYGAVAARTGAPRAEVVDAYLACVHLSRVDRWLGQFKALN